MHVFHVVQRRVGRDLAQLGDFTRQAVDIGQGKVQFCFLGSGQQVQNGIGGAAHCNIQAHGVLESLEVTYVARQHRVIILVVVTFAKFHNQAARAQEQLLPVGVGGQHRAIARQTQAQGLGQAIHRIGGEHAGTGAAGGAGRTLVLGDQFITG